MRKSEKKNGRLKETYEIRSKNVYKIKGDLFVLNLFVF